MGAVGLDAVVASALPAIERRRRMVVVRRSITPIMWMLGVLHRCSNAPSDTKLEALVTAAHRVRDRDTTSEPDAST